MDKKEVMEFEMTEDMDHLPDSQAFKVYIRCWGELTEGLDPKSNKVLLGKFSEYFADLTREQQEIYVRMGRGCVKRIKLIKDFLEYSYEALVCVKQNDNEVNFGEEKRYVILMLCSLSTSCSISIFFTDRTTLFKSYEKHSRS